MLIRDKDHPAPFSADFETREEWEARARFLRRQVLVSQGLYPMPAKTPLDPIVTRTIDQPDYQIHNVAIESMPGHRVFGNLYVPKSTTGKVPVVLHPHGHWPDGRLNWQDDEKIAEQLASGAEVTREGARAPLQAFSATLAQMGCIVFHFDMVGYADSTAIPHREGFDDVDAVLRLQSVMGLQSWNCIRALDYVLTLPNADPSRVAICGASGGGTQSILLTAIDDRITCSVPVVMISMNMQGGCVCENASLLRIGTNNVELAALAAPRPLGGVGAQDWTHDFETRGLPELKRIYQLYDAEENVDGKVFPYPHNFNHHSRQWCYEFLNRHLRLGRSGRIEERFSPVTRDQLRVEIQAEQYGCERQRESMTRESDRTVESLSAGELKEAWEATLSITEIGISSEIADEWSDHDGDCFITLGLNPQDYPSRKWPDMTLFVSPETASETPIVGHHALVLGYNQSTLAKRVYEVARLVATLRSLPKARAIRLLATKEHYVVATLASVFANIDSALIEQSDFDFDQITDLNDPNLLPSALKYGGMKALRRLCPPSVRFVDDLNSALDQLVLER